MKRTPYVKSELRLVESLDGICDRLLEYNLHKEHSDSRRFSRGMSQTFKTLHGLVDRGVKVDLGIPQELWDKPSAEVSNLKVQCEMLLEKYEDDIENWYWNNGKDLMDYLCVKRVLKGEDANCLVEERVDENKPDDSEKEEINKISQKDDEGFCDSEQDVCDQKPQ